jgi:mevalonate kinase
VTAVNRYLTARVSFSEGKDDVVVTPEVSDQSFIKEAIKIFRNQFNKKQPIHIETKSEIGYYGLGSSAATVVATVKALLQLFKIKINSKTLFDLCYKTVLNVQGSGSGFDVASAIYGGTLYFAQKGKIIESLNTDNIPLVVGYSGVKADTVSQINLVGQKLKNYKEGVEKIFENIAKLVSEAKQAINSKDWVRLGTLMNYNEDYLENLGVSTEKLNAMILAARKAGAYGAKLSGAGGGDCIIALVSKETENQVKEAINCAGGQIIKV